MKDKIREFIIKHYLTILLSLGATGFVAVKDFFVRFYSLPEDVTTINKTQRRQDSLQIVLIKDLEVKSAMLKAQVHKIDSIADVHTYYLTRDYRTFVKYGMITPDE